MIIKNPNDEQLSAWLGANWRLARAVMRNENEYGGTLDELLTDSFPDGIYWPDDWPDLSRLALMSDRFILWLDEQANAVHFTASEIMGNEKRSRINASNTNRRKSKRRKVVSKQYRASYDGGRGKAEVWTLRRK